LIPPIAYVHVQGLAGRPLANAELIEVMRLLRLLVEQQKLRDSHPPVALYCDWLLHGEIDRHEIAIEILKKMHMALVAYDQTHNTSGVSSALSLAQLRAEILLIFIKQSVSTNLMDSFANWNTFSGALLQDLRDRPLQLPKKPKGKTKKKMDNAIAEMRSASQKMLGSPWARAFFVTSDDEQGKRLMHWNVEWQSPALVGTDHMILKGELQMTEEASAFLRP
jgi:hypothetical protein